MAATGYNGKRRGPRLLVGAAATAALILCLIYAACVKDNKVKGVGNDTEQGSNPGNKSNLNAGGSIFNFNFQSVQQNAGYGTTALASMGWWVAARGRKREARSFNKVADCLEDNACDTCKAKVRKLRDEYIDWRVKRRFHPKRRAA